MVRAMVINVDERDKRIGLSTKAFKKIEEKKETDNLNQADNRAFSTLGDLLEPAMRKNEKDKEE